MLLKYVSRNFHTHSYLHTLSLRKNKYRLGIIKSYCQQDVEGGICCLKMASAQGFYRAAYALGLVLRDSHPDEANFYMKNAADARYIPALQELLPARQMKAKYGEPKADELRLHLDPLCLNRLLSRHYVKSADLRCLNTSHCWNPLCGRWAFKATVNSNGQAVHHHHGPPPPPPPRRPHHHHHAMHLRRVVSRLGGGGGAAAAADPAAQPLLSANSSLSSSSFTNSSSLSNNNIISNSSSSGSNAPPPVQLDVRVSRMKMCSRCCRAKYCSKLCQVYDWRSGRHKMECQFL
jgi:MYND finger